MNEHNSHSLDTQIWTDFKKGSEEAYAALYSRYFFMLFRYGKKISPDRDFVKDCIQDLFVELWRNRSNLSNPESVKNYLFKSIRRKIIRKAAFQNRHLYEDQLPADNEDVVVLPYEFHLVNSQLIQEQNEDLLKALDALTKRQREAVFLKFYDNLTYQETAAIMSISVEAVYNLISKAIDILQQHMKKIYMLLAFLHIL